MNYKIQHDLLTNEIIVIGTVKEFEHAIILKNFILTVINGMYSTEFTILMFVISQNTFYEYLFETDSLINLYLQNENESIEHIRTR